MSKYTMFVVIQALCASVIGFAGIVAVLVMGYVNAKAIIAAIVVGFLLSLPIAWVIKDRMMKV